VVELALMLVHPAKFFLLLLLQLLLVIFGGGHA
jgi:hypothetical protein